MLIISAGMQKAGTAYFYNLLRLLVSKSGGADANEIKQHEGLSDVMKWANNNVGKLDAAKVLKLWWISIKHGSYVVKTHGGYISKWLKFPIRIGGLKLLYITETQEMSLSQCKIMGIASEKKVITILLPGLIILKKPMKEFNE